MSKYGKLISLSTNYATRMKRLSNEIFGNIKRPTNAKSIKVANMFSKRPLYENDFVINYYPRHVETGKLMMKLRELGLYRDEHQDFKEEMVRLRALRGKVKPTRTRKGKVDE